MKVGNLVKFRYDGYNKSYGPGLVTKIQYDLGDGTGAAWALFKGELLMIRFKEVEIINETR